MPATTEMVLAINTPFDALENRKIESNIETLLPLVKERTAEYKATQYTISQEKLCREHRAQINKFLTAVNDEIKRVGKANNKPFEIFSKEIEPLVYELNETIKSLDSQISEMENRWRKQNLKNAEIIYNSIMKDSEYAEWISFEQVLMSKRTGRVNYEAYFGNKGTWSYPEGQEETTDLEIIMKSGKKVSETINLFLDMIERNANSIKAFEYPEDMTERTLSYLRNSYDPLKKAFDLDGAITLLKDIKRRDDEKREYAKKMAEIEKEKAQKAIEDAKRVAEEEKRTAIENFKKEVEEKYRNKMPEEPKPIAKEPEPNEAGEKLFVMRVYLTKEKAQKLTAFLKSEKITFDVQKQEG